MGTPYPHQDYRDFVIRKKPTTGSDLRSPSALNAAIRGGQVEAEKRQQYATGGLNHAGHAGDRPAPHGAAAAKIENETEDFHVPRVPTEIKHRITHYRNAKKMTQAQLAQAICVQPRIVQDYEKGTAIPDGNILSKMARVLGVPTLKK